MKKYLIHCFLSLFFVQCKCEGTFTTYTKIENLSTVDLSIKIYKGGLVDINKISNGKILKIEEKHGRTKAVESNSIFFNVDSIIVEFSDFKKSLHYNTIRGSNPNAIIYSDSRNLLNNLNYTQRTQIEDKCYLETDFVYTITKADYLNAK